MGRNRITQIIDDQEKKKVKEILTNKNQIMSVFKDLKTLDLSSNQFTRFPEELIYLQKIRELNLMNNQIETIPSTFYTSNGIMHHLRRLFLNQNNIRDLDPKIYYL